MVAFVQGLLHAPLEGGFFGPVQNAVIYRKVQSLLQDTLAKGANLALGGEQNWDAKGYFVNPVIVDRPADELPIVLEEHFGMSQDHDC